MWKDKSVAINYFDPIGFKRTLQVLTTDISIPNRARQITRLEEGLLPITMEEQSSLLKFAEGIGNKELYLMLLTGFYTGARIGTISTLRVTALENALPDPQAKGFWVIPIGPGTGISTKFDVSGQLLVPNMVMNALKDYALSRQRIERMIKANPDNKSFLFLTRQSNPYTSSSVDRQMVELRRKGRSAGMKFLSNFKFHQTRATYGTWLMSLCLKVTSVKTAIEFVKRAMHHKNESTTFGYITFIEHTKAKIEISNAFSEQFFGLKSKMK
jgi:integrase